MKGFLIGLSYLVTIIITAFITIKIHNEFLARQIMIDNHSLNLAQQQAAIDFRKKQLEASKAEQEIYARSRQSQIEAQEASLEQNKAEREAHIENRRKNAELEQMAKTTASPEQPKLEKFTESKRIGKVCDDKKCIYQVEIKERSFDPITQSWTIKTSKGTEAETLTN